MLTALTPRELMGRLEHASASLEQPAQSMFLAFDADGTLWDGDVGIDLFEALLESKQVREDAHEALVAEAERASLASEGTTQIVLERLYDAFRRGALAEDRAYAMMAWAFAGYTVDEARSFAETVVQACALRSRVRPELEHIIGWGKVRGISSVIVSASPTQIVRLGASFVGISEDHVFAMTPALTHTTLLSHLSHPPTYGQGKLAALTRAGLLETKTLLAAFGDSSYDVAMLKASRVPVAVDPKPSLLRTLDQLPDVVTLQLAPRAHSR